MPDRRTFLRGVSTAAALALTAASPAPEPSATPSPATSSSPKPPSAAARAQAEAMRRFDPHLGEEQIATIARGIDDAAAMGEHLNPHGTLLHNGDEPVTRFSAGPPRA